jgi:hypothetical protein
MTAKSPGAQAPHRALEPLYAFVRDHLAVVNGLVLASGSACAVVEALAPGLPRLTLAIRAATALVVALIVALALARRLAGGPPLTTAARVERKPSAQDTSRAPTREAQRQLLLWEETSSPASRRRGRGRGQFVLPRHPRVGGGVAVDCGARKPKLRALDSSPAFPP